jgi:hypothetical protein
MSKIGTIGKRTVYATAKGLKVGARGKVERPGAVYATLDKGARRRLRKALRAGGYRNHSAA